MMRMKTVRGLLLGLLTFGLATSAVALNNSEIPGSVLVFPKFLRGNVTIDGILHPSSEFEIGVTCPKGVNCFEGQRVKLQAHWVCPGSQKPREKFICRETDFVMQTTVTATITLNPDNNPPAVGFYGSSAPPQGGVRLAPCKTGYLIVWVVDQFDRPIKWDGLVGTAVLRNTAASADAYNAIPIQAAKGLEPGALTDVDGDGKLDFDQSEYRAVTGAITGTIRYDSDTAPLVVTTLTLLTLDVRSNRPNAPTFVDIDFYNQFEVPTSTYAEFICWGEFKLSDIDQNLSQALQGSRKGLLQSGPAEKVDIFGIDDPQEGYVTLIGIVETRELSAAGDETSYSYSLYNDGNYVPTYFKYDWSYPED